MRQASGEKLDDLRDRLLDAALERAAFDGWTGAMMSAAEADAGLPEGSASLASISGPVDLLDFWALRCDEAMNAAMQSLQLDAMRVREKVSVGVRARIEAIGEENREAARRAAARLALPDAAARGAHMMWRASDRIWRALGDPSTDGNFYSKRAILTGVVTGVLSVWVSADGPEDDAPWRFLDRRIENVMQFEKAKARMRKLAEGLPSPVELAAALRYPRR